MRRPRASRGSDAPCIPTIGTRSPSSRAYGSAELVIRPVTIATATPASTAARTAATVRGRIRRSSPTSVPSRSSATSRMRPVRPPVTGVRLVTAAARDARRGRPRRSAAGRQDPPRPRSSSRAASTPRRPSRSRAWSAPISRRARPAASSRAGSSASRRRMTSSPSGPPSSASRGSNPIGAGRPARSPVRMYGRFAQTRSKRSGVRSSPAPVPAAGRRSATATPTWSATPWATAFSAASCGRPGRLVRRDDLHLRGHATPPQGGGDRDRDGAGARPDVGDANRRRPDRARRAAQHVGQLGEGEIHEELRLGARHERPGVHGEGDRRGTP